jgi:hypothetical protein
VTFVTRERDRDEADSLLALCHPQPDEADFVRTLGELETNEAALLPGAEEAHGVLRRFRLAPRLTTHVRHRSKYADMPVLDAHAFVFSDGGPGPRARSLRELTMLLAAQPEESLSGHFGRRDFSRWMTDVFRDQPLAARLRQIESAAVEPREAAELIVQAIRARYELEE